MFRTTFSAVMHVLKSTLGIAMLLTGCQGDSTERENRGPEIVVNEPGHPSTDADHVTIYALPTPVQIPSLFHASNYNYSDAHLIPIDKNQKTYFVTALSLGMHMIDLSYVSMFRDKQKSLLYMKRMHELLDELGIESEVNPAFAARFEQHIENPDSLNMLILDAYEKGHQYFKDHQREGIGLLIISGCFVEGLYLALHEARQQDLFLFYRLISQQKFYLNNLLEILDHFQYDSEVEGIVKKFRKIHRHYLELDLPPYQVNEDHAELFGSPEYDEHLTVIKDLISEIRSEILN